MAVKVFEHVSRGRNDAFIHKGQGAKSSFVPRQRRDVHECLTFQAMTLKEPYLEVAESDALNPDFFLARFKIPEARYGLGPRLIKCCAVRRRLTLNNR